ncbi:MAG: major capsid protein [Pseudomonadota bacterium]
MATIGNTFLTYSEWFNRHDPKGNGAMIVEILSDNNDAIFQDSVVGEANGSNGHESTIRTGLPGVYYRSINEGIPSSMSTTATVEDTFTNFESKSDIDKDLMERNGNSNAFRLTEDAAFLESMQQEAAECLFYGNPASNPKQYLGLSSRFASFQASQIDKTKSSHNVVHGGGAGEDNCSIWFMQWDPLSAFMFHPQGGKPGIQAMPENEARWVTDKNGREYKAYTTHYKYQDGLALKDWRGIARIANIDVSALRTAGAADLIDLMITAYYRRRMPNRGRNVIYVPWLMQEFLHKQAKSTDNVDLTLREYAGMEVVSFMGIPIKPLDVLRTDEDLVPEAA